MLAFGPGTLPNLVATSALIGSRAGHVMSGSAMRHAAAAMMIGFGMLGTWRVIVAPVSSGQGPFCL